MLPSEYKQEYKQNRHEYLKKLGAKIRAARIENGMSQDDLALACGWKSRSSINKIEHGLYDVPVNKLEKIIKELKLDPGFFLDFDTPLLSTKDIIDMEEEAAIDLARKILRLDPYRRALIESIINTEPESHK